MEKQVTLEIRENKELEFDENKFAKLSKKEQADFMERKWSFILKLCEELLKKSNINYNRII